MADKQVAAVAKTDKPAAAAGAAAKDQKTNVIEKKMDDLTVGDENSRGIPPAQFIENIEQFLSEKKEPIDKILKEIQILYSKYKVLQAQLDQTKMQAMAKIPDINRAIDIVTFLMTKQKDQTLTTHYELAEPVFAKAKFKTDGTCFLWLGGDVMLEYTYKEALDLLKGSLDKSLAKLKVQNKDLAFLADQITISEVIIFLNRKDVARLHNYRVQMNRAAAVASAKTAAAVTANPGS